MLKNSEYIKQHDRNKGQKDLSTIMFKDFF
jgi:hypothetical protein